MDLDQETKNFKRMLFVILTFLVSAFFAYRELKYTLWGQTIDAQIVRTYQTTPTGRRGRPMLVVEYSFQDAGQTRREGDRVSLDTPLASDTSVPIQYLPGTDLSRLAGNRNLVSVWIFLGTLALLAFFLIRLIREGQQSPHPTPSRRR